MTRAASLLLAGLLLVSLPIAVARAQVCTMSSTAMAFGTYNHNVSYPAFTTTATITVTCNPAGIALLVSYTVSGGFGTGGGRTFATRRMSGTTVGTDRLGYQMYLDAGYSQVFGDGSGGTYEITDNYLLDVGPPVTRTYTIYGKVPAGTDKPDTYNDSVTALLNYSGVVANADRSTEFALMAAPDYATCASPLPPRGRRRPARRAGCRPVRGSMRRRGDRSA